MHCREWQPTVILTYHEIVPESASNLYGITPAQLDQHLQLLKEASQHSSKETQPQVTFDDGHISNFEYALPVLEAHKVTAIFFVPPAYVGSRAIMTWQHLRDLVALGHRVESHTWSHRRLTACSDSQLRDELRRSKVELEDQLGATVETISMPYGRWNRRVLRACSLVGYREVFTSDPWLRNREQEGVTTRGRLTVRRTMNPAQLRRLLSARGLQLIPYRLPYVLKDALKLVLGDQVYHRLWCLVASRHESLREGWL